MSVMQSFDEARLRRRISELEAALERAEDQVAEMRLTFGLEDACQYAWLGMSRSESIILALLMRHDMVTKDQMMFALYDGKPEAYDRDPKILDVWIHKLRKRLAPLGVEIELVWGRGKRIGPAGKAKLLAAMPRAAE